MEAVEQVAATSRALLALYWMGVWSIGTTCGLCVCIIDRNYRNGWHLFALAVSAGFLAFAVVSICYPNGTGDGHSFARGLGLSALIGLSGKYHPLVVRAMLRKVFGKVELTEELLTSEQKPNPQPPEV